MRIKKHDYSDNKYMGFTSTTLWCDNISYSMTFHAIIDLTGTVDYIHIEYSHNNATFGQDDYGVISCTKDKDIFLDNEMKDLCTHWSLYPESEKHLINEFKELINEAIKKEAFNHEEV